MPVSERQVTQGPGGRLLTNIGVWSPDSEWIVYDTRSDAAGAVFDGRRIEMAHVGTGRTRLLYESRQAACCGVATFHPREWKVAFILGPENPAPDWQYGAWHRQGVIVSVPASARVALDAGPSSGDGHGLICSNLDARDLTPPFTPGALRGGSHVHVWDAVGEWVSFTYEDHLLAQFASPGPTHDINQRNIGVSVPGRPVRVSRTHQRNQDGDYFSVLVTRTAARPRPGSDEISRACEEGWIGAAGYRRADGTRQRRALAFQGQVVAAAGEPASEVFVADLPEDLSVPGDGPLAGTETRMPSPPKGVIQRRLTFTTGRKFAGLQGPRHWLRSSPDGARIAFLMKDDAGVVQIWTVSPLGGSPTQLTRNPWPIASAFTWSPDGRFIAHAMDNSICVTDTTTGVTRRLTPRSEDRLAPRPEACVFSPDGRQIAFVRPMSPDGQPGNQICVISLAAA
jgi:hypothetical protein